MNKGLRIFLIGMGILIPGGLAAYAGIELWMLSKLCYKLSGYKIISINNKFIDLEISLKVKNPSKMKIDLNGYYVNIKLNSVQVANIINSHETTLKPMEVTEIKIPIKIDLKAFGQIKATELLLAFASRDMSKIKLSFDGKFRGELMKIPISKEIKMDYTIAQIIEEIKKPGMPCDVENKK